ncbi:dihydroorotase [Allohahella marinimesophila]|uniref:Dihydroorotase n=1 Tax=Allohahella marinimesophila TaxID=1054972 RepID=A0ABP7P392_9GAMM
MTDLIRIRRPDDWHLHLRDGPALADTVAATAAQFHRAIVMPNLVPPVTTGDQADAYKARIMAAAQAAPGSPADSARSAPASLFTPLMTLYLTDTSQPELVRAAFESGQAVACKLYPAGATTNSDSGVTGLERIADVLAVMQDIGMPLLIHGEVTDANIDIFDREQVFIERTLRPLCQRYPQLRVVLEHITTSDAVDFVRSAGPHVAATITAHHLHCNRNHMLAGGIRPHYFCLPILKRSSHQMALREAATSGSPKFFLGTDSAPHAVGAKESACGCAGCYTAPLAMQLYATVFDEMNALDRLEGFASRFGADFYGLPVNEDFITLQRRPWTIPDAMALGAAEIRPLLAGQTLEWTFETDSMEDSNE